MSQKETFKEYNFDGLIGPTHNFAGLAQGNIASLKSRYAISHPKQAALQALEKMKLLFDLGIPQCVIPPQERPSVSALRAAGFSGPDEQVVTHAGEENFNLLLTCSSSSFMWTANAATISPSVDSTDGKVHLTPANLATFAHRAIEPKETQKILSHIFEAPEFFKHHDLLPANGIFFDEGAANHMRLAKRHGTSGIQLFVYGKNGTKFTPQIYPARQSHSASEKISKLHCLNPNQIVFARQNPEVIDLGVFHNDLIAFGNENILIFHERAFVDADVVTKELSRKYEQVSGEKPHFVCVTEAELSVREAVESYFFNGQLVTLPSGKMALIAPTQCQVKNSKVMIDSILKNENQIKEAHFVDLEESMMNGGGPACLRLRVVLSKKEAAAIHPGCMLTEERYEELSEWVKTHYRDKLHLHDLKDPALLRESRSALDKLTQILDLGDFYSFQL